MRNIIPFLFIFLTNNLLAQNFVETNDQLIGVRDSSIKWGDYDNDGDLDILLVGQDIHGISRFRIYRNSNGVFDELILDISNLPIFLDSSADWGDFDNDGDLDFIVSGFTRPAGGEVAMTKIYQNDLINSGFNQNTKPSSPNNLTSNVKGNTIILSWNIPQNNADRNLSFNVYLENIDRNLYFMNPMSNIGSGQRSIVSFGNAQLNTKIHVTGLPKGRYLWTVQSIDNSYMSSKFSNFQYFDIDSNTGLPKVITPNGDGLNDNFKINLGIEPVSLEIYNRWGALVFKDNNYKNNWDGKNLNAGIYYYSVSTLNNCDQIKGWVQILR